MPPVPFALALAFILTTFLALGLLLRAATAQNRQEMLAALGMWLLAQALVARSGFYTITNTLPPRRWW